MSVILDGLRLSVGTLTAIRVGPTTEIGPGTARWAMLLAPVAVLPLGLLAGLEVWAGAALGLPPPVVGLTVVGTLALGSRALHVDGLSDVADGLTASYDAERSLATMRSGTSGPAGTVALLVVLGVQAAAVGALVPVAPAVGGWRAGLLVAGLVCLSRCALVLACARGVRAARADGLGAVFAETVPPVLGGVVWVVAVAALQGLLAWAAPAPAGPRGLMTGAVALAVVALLLDRSRRRLGGVTGDVYGAAVEMTLAVLLAGSVVTSFSRLA